jgi:predicted GNAT family N-acyltransferase
MADVRQITAAETIPLRHSVLRAGYPIETARFPGDDDPGTVHFGVFEKEKLLCIATLLQAQFPPEPGISAFQLRGMAAVPESRGSGLGTQIVRTCVDFAREKSARMLWCNARTSAAGFYLKLGFQIVGDEFDIPTVGPHVRMKLSLGPLKAG